VPRVTLAACYSPPSNLSKLPKLRSLSKFNRCEAIRFILFETKTPWSRSRRPFDGYDRPICFARHSRNRERSRREEAEKSVEKGGFVGNSLSSNRLPCRSSMIFYGCAASGDMVGQSERRRRGSVWVGEWRFAGDNTVRARSVSEANHSSLTLRALNRTFFPKRKRGKSLLAYASGSEQNVGSANSSVFKSPQLLAESIRAVGDDRVRQTSGSI